MTRPKILLISGIVLVAVLGAAGGWWMLSQRGPSTPNVGDSVEETPSASSDVTGAPVTYPGPESDSAAGIPTTNTLEEIQNPERVVYLKPGSIGMEGPEAFVTLADLLQAREGGQDPAANNGSVAIPDQTAGTGGGSVAAPTGDGSADPDSDGLTNDQERQQGTNPQKADSDADGLTDGDEVRSKRTDPRRADTDGDALTDGEEVSRWKTDPLNPDTDGDGYPDGTEAKGGYNPRGPGKL